MGDEEIVENHHIRRQERVFAYLALVTAGILLTIEPSGIISGSVSPWIETAWSLCMIVSALICLLGSATDRWVGEYTGIPLLSSVLGLYSIAACLTAWGDSIPLFAFGMMLGGLAFKLVARWKDVRGVKYLAELQGRADNGGQE